MSDELKGIADAVLHLSAAFQNAGMAVPDVRLSRDDGQRIKGMFLRSQSFVYEAPVRDGFTAGTATLCGVKLTWPVE